MKAAEIGSTPQPPVVAGPWLGLESYREQDADRFFGREKETGELLRMVRREVLTIVFGPSGIGKTSLLRAGLFRRLIEEDHFPVYIRPTYSEDATPIGGQVKDCIREAAAERKIDEDAGAAAGSTLWEYLHTAEFWSANNRLLTPVLFLDQFEEVFTLGAGLSGSETFLKELAEIVENYLPAGVERRFEANEAKIPPGYRRQPYKVVITLREDFVHRLDALRKSMPAVMQNRYPLGQLNGRQALEAVGKPGKTIVTPAVAERIVRFAASGSKSEGAGAEPVELEDLRVEPALLSVVCQELYSRAVWEGKSEITAVAVDTAGADILDDFYERSFRGLPSQARVFVEDRLLTASGFRNTAPLEDAVSAGVDQATISALVERRLIRVEQRLGIPHLELTHDLLAKVVQTNRKARQERERRIAAEQEQAEQARSLGRARRMQVVLGLAVLLSLAFAGVAVYEAWAASRSAAEANRLRDVAADAERRAKDAEYIAQCRLGIETAENLAKTSRAAGDLQAATDYEGQVAVLKKRLEDFRAGTWRLPAAVATPAPTPAAISKYRPVRPDTLLANSDVDPAQFVANYGRAFRPPSAAEGAAMKQLIGLLNQDNAISDVRWAAYILATIRYEGGLSWRPDSEKGPPERFITRYGPGTRLGSRLGNTDPDDAFRYRGRGYLFLTGKANYARYGALMGMGDQLVRNPDLLLDPAVAYRLTSQGMVKGWFSGRKLADFISGDAADYVNARLVAGRGLDHALDISQAAGKLEQVLSGSLTTSKAKLN